MRSVQFDAVPLRSRLAASRLRWTRSSRRCEPIGIALALPPARLVSSHSALISLSRSLSLAFRESNHYTESRVRAVLPELDSTRLGSLSPTRLAVDLFRLVASPLRRRPSLPSHKLLSIICLKNLEIPVLHVVRLLHCALEG